MQKTSSRATDKAYADWKGWSGGSFGACSREDRVYFRAELRACGIPDVTGLNVLELGFGNGSFAGWTRAQSGRWCGLEQSELLVARALQAGFRAADIRAGVRSIAQPGTVDLVVAFDVLEHMQLADVRAFLLEARDVLKTGGVFVGRVPSGDSPFSGAIFHGDLTHRTLLGSNALRQLATDCEYEVLHVRPTTLPIRGLGLKRFVRRAVVHSIRAVAYAVIREALIGDNHAIMSPNMTFVLKSRPHQVRANQ